MGMFNNYIKEDKMELTNVNSKIDNIEIGGRNLLTGTDTGVGYTYYKNPSSSENNAYFDNENKYFVLKAGHTGDAYTDSINMYSPYISLNKGQYTLSFDLKSDTPINRMQIFYIVYDSIGEMNSSKSLDIDTPIYDTKIDNYIKYKCIFNLPEDYPIIKIRIDNDHRATHAEDQIIYIKNLKLEKGNKATDWTPAPEDYMNAIAESVAEINGDIEDLQKQIDGEVNAWFMEGEPTTTSKPASDWTGKDENGVAFDYRQRHEGDTYTDISEITLLTSDMWEIGGIGVGSEHYQGKVYNSCKYDEPNRLRLKNTIECKAGSILFIPSGYAALVSYYDNSNVYNGNNKHYTANGTIEDKGTRMSIQLIGSSAVSVEQADTLKLSLNPTAGQSWRWCNVDDEYGTGWHWHKIADSDAVKALQEAVKSQQLANNAQNTADTAVTAANNAQNTADTAQTIASGVRTDFDNLEIGSRNLLRNSNVLPISQWATSNATYVNGTEYSTMKMNVSEIMSTCTTCTAGESRITDKKWKDKNICISVAVKSSKDIGLKVGIIIRDSNNTNISQNYYNMPYINVKAGEWTRIYSTYKCAIDVDTDNISKIYLVIGSSTTCSVGDEFNIKNWKIEFGNKATDWTPTPEDLMPYVQGSTGNIIYNDGTKWTTVSTPSTYVHNILTIGGGTYSPTWFTGPSAGSNISLLTAGGGTGMSWTYGPSSESLMTIGGASLRWITGPSNYSAILTTGGGTGVRWMYGPSSSSNISLLVGGGGTNSIRWESMESMRGPQGAGYIHTMGENVDDSILENPENTETTVSSFGFRAGDYTISTNGTIWYYNGTSFERGINLKS